MDPRNEGCDKSIQFNLKSTNPEIIAERMIESVAFPGYVITVNQQRELILAPSYDNSDASHISDSSSQARGEQVFDVLPTEVTLESSV